METKSNIKIIPVIVIVMLAIIAGVFGGMNISKYKEEKKVQLKEDTISYLGKEHTKAEIESVLKENFSQLSKSDCTEIIDLYIHATYAVASQALIDDAMTNDIYAVMDENGSFDFDKIEDEETKDLCKVLADENVVVRFVNGNLFFDVDYGYFADTYGAYLQEDFVEMLRLFNEEKTVDYYDAESDSLCVDVVEERLLKAYDMIERYPNSGIKGSAEDYYNFYKKIYLGAYAQDYIFDSGIKIRSEIVNRYSYFAEEIKDPEFKAFLIELSEAYKEVDNSRTTDIYKMIKDHCGITE